MSANALEGTNLRKAAIIVAALGEELAGEVCASLTSAQLVALGEEISQLQHVPAGEFNAVLDEFLATARTSTNLGGPQYAQTLLEEAARGARRAMLPEGDLDGTPSMGYLNDIDTALLARVLRDETRQTMAAVLSHLTAGKAGQMLADFEGEVAADIAYRAARLSSPSPGAMQALAVALDQELSATHTRVGSAPDVSLQFVVDLIGSLSPARGKQILEALHHVDGEFGQGVAEQVFTFEDVVTLSDNDLQVLLRQVDMSVLVLALKGTAEDLRDRVRQNLSQRGRERLEEEMAMLGPTPLSQVQDAQRQVCQQARSLAEAGEIGLESGSEEYVE